MRLIGWILLILVGLGWLAAEVPLPGPRTLSAPGPNDSLLSDWRRTDAGWERSAVWATEPKGCRPAVHPVVLGLLQLLLASAALIAFSKGEDWNRRATGRILR